ncbi:hypothetical protein DMN91_002065 [Ooceraea biroi]|uniref:Leucine-rich repeat-containing protein n=1 Tax=Ooceraea biroi TaxID=2015173 RepID=A0A3L8E093_OOCBI|nr:hypothetical protein DMN91_002065 [Ooceraea biroi]
MSDIADALLAQYYGFSKNSKPEKFLSIHECVSHAENDVHKLVGEQSTADTNDDDTSKETELQANNVENEESNSEDIPVRSSQALEREALDDDEETGFDIIFEGDTGNVFENINASSSKKAKDLTLNTSKAISTILAPEDNEGNDLYLSLSEDALADSASDISSVAGRKTSPKSSTRFASPSTPPQEKVPVYNETFIDLAGTGLTSLPIEMVKNYFIIRMLYLENNSLTELPKELFASLPKLQWLDVRNNQLTSLPASIKSHPSLETILLEGNKIEKLPLELCLVPKLKILNVAHNPIVEPPEDVIALGCSSILNYLRTKWNKLHPNGSVKFVEQRIEPRLSTILCYQSPREKRLKLPKISRRTLKSANNIGDSSTGMSTRKKSRAYKPSNRNEIAEVNAKILHLIGPSPRSRYVRQNVTGLITYRQYRGKECKIKAISNETKYIALAKKSDNSVALNEGKKKNAEHTELVFDIVTKDMQRMRLRPTQLKDSRCILSCLENYLGIGTN